MRTDRAYTYYIPITPEMLGQTCDIYVLANEAADDDLQPTVYHAQ